MIEFEQSWVLVNSDKNNYARIANIINWMNQTFIFKVFARMSVLHVAEHNMYYFHHYLVLLSKSPISYRPPGKEQPLASVDLILFSNFSLTRPPWNSQVFEVISLTTSYPLNANYGPLTTTKKFYHQGFL